MDVSVQHHVAARLGSFLHDYDYSLASPKQAFRGIRRYILLYLSE